MLFCRLSRLVLCLAVLLFGSLASAQPAGPPLEADYRLEFVTAAPGDTVAVGLGLEANFEIAGFSAGVLTPAGVGFVGANVGAAIATADFVMVDEASGPAGPGVTFGVVVDFAASNLLPEGVEHSIFEFCYQVPASASLGAVFPVELTNQLMPFGSPPPVELLISDAAGVEVIPTLVDGAIVLSSPFLRGDVDESGGWDIGDAVTLLDRLFGTPPIGNCLAALDVNSDQTLDVSDPIYLLIFLFEGGPAPVAVPGVCSTSSAQELPCIQFLCP